MTNRVRDRDPGVAGRHVPVTRLPDHVPAEPIHLRGAERCAFLEPGSERRGATSRRRED